jgi:hypothetical protein
MTKGAGLIAVHRKLPVVVHRLAEQLELLHPVVGRIWQAFQCCCVDTIDFRRDPTHLLQRLRRQRLVCLCSGCDTEQCYNDW